MLETLALPSIGLAVVVAVVATTARSGLAAHQRRLARLAVLVAINLQGKLRARETPELWAALQAAAAVVGQAAALEQMARLVALAAPVMFASRFIRRYGNGRE